MPLSVKVTFTFTGSRAWGQLLQVNLGFFVCLFFSPFVASETVVFFVVQASLDILGILLPLPP